MKKLLSDINRSLCRRLTGASIVLFSLTQINNADGQTIINAGPDQNLSTCGAATTLSATITPTQSTSSYTVSTIAYNADPYNQGTLVSLADDQITSASIALPFDFCFYGNLYNRIYICSNNWIGFSPGQTPSWSTVAIPNASGSAPRNCIMGPWQDINPASGGQIRYAVYGTAPFRRFVVSYSNIPMYLCTGMMYTSQIKIFETTNVIETHISNKPLCTNWNSGRAVHGLHNANGTQATIVVGRNNTQWTTANEGTRFTPAGNNSNYHVEWLDANNNVISTNTTASVTPAANSTYTVRISYLCPAQQYTDQVQVTVPSLPTTNFTLPATGCVGQAATITYTGNGSNNATYNWNFGGGTVVSGSGRGPYQISWSTPGVHNVSLDIVQNGCPTSVNTQAITIYDLPTATFSVPASVCNPDTVQVTYTGSATNGTFNWNFAGANVISGTDAGPYTISWGTQGAKAVILSVTENGCQSVPDTNNVMVYRTPTATFTANSPVCQYVSMGVTYNGIASGNATYNWNFGNATVNSGSGQGPYQIQFNTPGTQTLSLTVTENGCTSAVQTANVLVNVEPTSTFNPTTPICLNTASTILYTGNATNTATFNWNFDNGNIISGSNNGPYQIMWSTPGVKNISLTVAQNGCVSPQTTMVVNVDSIPPANAGADVAFCSGQQIQIGTQGINGAIYTWSPMAGLVANNVAQPTVNLVNNTTAPVTSAYIVSVSYGNQCVNSDTVNVTVKPTPVVAFTAPAPQCLDNNQFDIYANGSYSNNAVFAWDIDNSPATQTTATISNSFTTEGWHTFRVSATDYGCTSNPYTDSVFVNPMPVVNFTADNVVGCMPFSTQFFDASYAVDGIAAYKWNFEIGASASANPNFEFTQDGVYDITLTVTSTNGCTATLTQQNFIWAKPTPTADFSVSTTTVDAIYDPFVTVTNLSDGQYFFYNWGDGQTSTSPYGEHSYPNPGTYTITQVVKNSYGCMDSTSRTIVSKPSQTIYLPTAFTPNNDHTNESFKAVGLAVKNFTMNIYNRWGQLVFSTGDINHGWDGTYQGADCQQGVYTYKVTYDMYELTGEGRQQVIDGMVTLLR